MRNDVRTQVKLWLAYNPKLLRNLCRCTCIVTVWSATSFISSWIGYCYGILHATPPLEPNFPEATGEQTYVKGTSPFNKNVQVKAYRRYPCPPKYLHQVLMSVPGVEVPGVWGVIQWGWRHEHNASQVVFDENLEPILPGQGPTEWRHFMWNDSTIEALLESRYPWLLPTYRSYPKFMQRINTAKWAVLHTYGGMYVDLDVAHRRSWNGVWNLCPECIVPQHGSGWLIGSDVFLLPKGHALAEQMINGLPHQVTTWWSTFFYYCIPYLYVMCTTGTLYLNFNFMEYTYRVGWAVGKLIVLGDLYYSGEVTVYKLTAHYKGDTWHEWDAALIKGFYWAFRKKFLFVFIGLLAIIACIFRVNKGRRLASGGPSLLDRLWRRSGFLQKPVELEA